MAKELDSDPSIAASEIELPLSTTLALDAPSTQSGKYRYGLRLRELARNGLPSRSQIAKLITSTLFKLRFGCGQVRLKIHVSPVQLRP